MANTYAIRTALFLHLTDSLGVQEAAVCWPGIDFTRPIEGTWYRASLIPGVPTAAAIGIGAPDRHVGVLQIDVCMPAADGDVPCQWEADRIATGYKRGTYLPYGGVIVRCNKAYQRTYYIEEDSWIVIPVIVEYQADVAP